MNATDAKREREGALNFSVLKNYADEPKCYRRVLSCWSLSNVDVLQACHILHNVFEERQEQRLPISFPDSI